MKVIQEILSPSSFQVTADTYIHLVANELKDAMKVIDDVFSKPSTVAGTVAGPNRQTVQ
jgi:hypothetical protein